MDLFEAILGFIAGIVFFGFFCVLFNLKFKIFFIMFIFNLVNFIIYLVLAYFAILSFSGIICFTFGVAGILGFILPVTLMFF